MRKISTPPDDMNLLKKLSSTSPEKISHIIEHSQLLDQHGKYRHWDKLKYLEPPKNITSEEWWAAIKIARRSQYIKLPLHDKNNKYFNLSVIDSMYEDLHFMDCHISGSIHLEEPIINPQTRDTYLINSLIEESISSSQLEGASTTRRIAKEMLKSERKPKSKDELMIYNNYIAMRFIYDNKDIPLTPALIYELHKLVSTGTLEDPKDEGNIRTKDDVMVVDDATNEVLHAPPKATDLKGHIQELCDFANNTQNSFIHPIVKAVILHFMLAYYHPFVDGNGRTARALFYWFMAKSGYWLMEYVSISNILKSAPSQYARSYLYVETDENDLTYFVIYQLEVMRKAIDALNDYLSRKARKVREVKHLIANNSKLQNQLNTRQLALLHHAIRHPNFRYEIKTHQKNHGVTYETARNDLLQMSNKLNLLEKLKQGRSYVFISPADLDSRINQNT